MTIKEEISQLKFCVNSLKSSIYNLRKDFRDYQGFVIQSNLEMMITIKDLHDRLQYIKSYIGAEEFMNACKEEKIDDSNHPST